MLERLNSNLITNSNNTDPIYISQTPIAFSNQKKFVNIHYKFNDRLSPVIKPIGRVTIQDAYIKNLQNSLPADIKDLGVIVGNTGDLPINAVVQLRRNDGFTVILPILASFTSDNPVIKDQIVISSRTAQRMGLQDGNIASVSWVGTYSVDSTPNRPSAGKPAGVVSKVRKNENLTGQSSGTVAVASTGHQEYLTGNVVLPKGIGWAALVTAGLEGGPVEGEAEKVMIHFFARRNIASKPWGNSLQAILTQGRGTKDVQYEAMNRYPSLGSRFESINSYESCLAALVDSGAYSRAQASQLIREVLANVSNPSYVLRALKEMGPNPTYFLAGGHPKTITFKTSAGRNEYFNDWDQNGRSDYQVTGMPKTIKIEGYKY